MKGESQKSRKNRFHELADESDYEDEPNAEENKKDHMMMCETCVFGSTHESIDRSTIDCPGCGRMTDKLFQAIEKGHHSDEAYRKQARLRQGGARKTKVSMSTKSFELCNTTIGSDTKNTSAHKICCVTKLSINNVAVGASGKIDDITLKLENLKVIGDQIRDSLNSVRPNNAEADGNWKRLSLTVDSGACDNVVDPRGMPGYTLKETKESRNGETFVTASGDLIPQLGEKEATIYIDGGALTKLRTQRTIVSKPLLLVKRMIEAGHFVGFCEQGGFLLDLHSGHLEWFREGNGNYMLDTWLVPHSKANELDNLLSEDFRRQSK